MAGPRETELYKVRHMAFLQPQTLYIRMEDPV